MTDYDDKIFDLIEGGSKLDLFGIPLSEGAEEVAKVSGGVGDLIENVSTEGLTPQPGEFIPSEAGLDVGDEASKAMEKQIKDEVNPMMVDVGGKTEKDVMEEHGIYKRTDDGQTFTTQEDLTQSTAEKRQALLDARDPMSKFKKKSTEWLNDQGVNVHDLNLTEEEWAEMKIISDKQEELQKRIDKHSKIMTGRKSIHALGWQGGPDEVDKILRDSDKYMKELQDYYRLESIGSIYPNPEVFPTGLPAQGVRTDEDVFQRQTKWLERESRKLQEELSNSSMYKKYLQQIQGQDDPDIYDMIPK
tara:strand:- start:21 stop:929 length:909 start_codon:yes stop_codon:yes gene_type:complete